MRATRSSGRGQSVPRPEKVEKIELSEKNQKLRLALAIAFLVLGAAAIAYGVSSVSEKKAGWTRIEVSSSALNCGDDFVFLYNLGAGETSATKEYKGLSAVYSKAAEYAFQLFSCDVEFEEVHNLYYLNRHPNEETEVDETLYQAFALLESFGDRSIYLAPVYEVYNGIFTCKEDYQAEAYDPRRNEETAEYYAKIAVYAGNEDMVRVELLGDNRVRLAVDGEYLSFARENEIENFIDFYWMKNAFIADYLADTVGDAGYTRGCISSRDGFIRNLDGSDTSYSFSFYDRVENLIYPAATIDYSGEASIVYLHDYPLSEENQFYYLYSDGTIRTPYLDIGDALCKSACSDLALYSYSESCAKVLLSMIPVYITDTLTTERLTDLSEEGLFFVYCRDRTLYYNDARLTVSSLYQDEAIRYSAYCQ